MPENDSTLPKIPRLKSPDNFILERAEYSARPDFITVQFPGIGKVRVTVPVGAELLLGRFEMHDIGSLCLNLIPFRAIEQGVSRRHARIKHSEASWWVEDMGSSNGTWLDGQRLTPYQPRCAKANSHLLLAQLECHFILPPGRSTTHKLTMP